MSECVRVERHSTISLLHRCFEFTTRYTINCLLQENIPVDIIWRKRTLKLPAKEEKKRKLKLEALSSEQDHETSLSTVIIILALVEREQVLNKPLAGFWLLRLFHMHCDLQPWTFVYRKWLYWSEIPFFSSKKKISSTIGVGIQNGTSH